jgi:hypothetical protein
VASSCLATNILVRPRVPRLVGQLEPPWPARLLLADGRTITLSPLRFLLGDYESRLIAGNPLAHPQQAKPQPLWEGRAVRSQPRLPQWRGW